MRSRQPRLSSLGSEADADRHRVASSARMLDVWRGETSFFLCWPIVRSAQDWIYTILKASLQGEPRRRRLFKPMGLRCAYSGLLVSALAAGACSAQVDDYQSDSSVGSTHALITVERTASADAAGSLSAGALAGFVRVPSDVDPRLATQLIGLELDLPPVDTCRVLGDRGASSSLAGMGHVEFLEAGSVSVSAAGSSTDLAPRAFPTVTDFISGVMYTTRERAAEPLPPDVPYTFRVSGGYEVPPLAVHASAPEPFAGVTVRGVPLAEAKTVVPGEPIDLTWSVGRTGDVVWLELGTADNASAVCVFRDEAGVGTVPASLFTGTGPGHISVHRTRTTSFAAQGLDRGVLRFDFELTASVRFVARP